MDSNVGKEVAALQRLTLPQLRARYAEVFGEAANTRNRGWLLKRVAWRIQALAEGTRMFHFLRGQALALLDRRAEALQAWTRALELERPLAAWVGRRVYGDKVTSLTWAADSAEAWTENNPRDTQAWASRTGPMAPDWTSSTTRR